MLIICFLLTALWVSPLGVDGQVSPSDTVSYSVSFADRDHHEAQVTVEFRGVQTDTLELRMSRSSPGRYSLHEFAKNVYAVKVEGEGGRLPKVDRPDPHGWTVSGHGGFVRVTYTLFGNQADGTYAAIDRSHAHLNMPAAFLWARGLEDRPIRIRFIPPEGSDWRVATQLAPTEDPYVFHADDLGYFMDSPTELSAFDLREWTVPAGGGLATIRIAAHTLDAPAELDAYEAMVRNVVAEQIGIFGELPELDHGTYTFIADYLPWVYGDGMEHRNSTVLTSTLTLRRSLVRVMGTVAHEFFHAWNVERIRPASLEPFDFEGPNPSQDLWFGEGFTSYYDDLTLRRARIIGDEEFARRIGDAISTVVNSPARRFGGPTDMSMLAHFADRAAFADPTNLENTFLSYYTWGSVVALALDLTLRSRFQGLSLDDFMRQVWIRHGRPFVPYRGEDLQAILAEITGDPTFAEEFFSRYVKGRDVPDMVGLLSHAGVLVRKAHPGRATLGEASLQLQFGAGGASLVGSTRAGTPLYQAGLDGGDRMLAVDGIVLSSRRVLEQALEEKGPGDSVVLTVEARGRTRRMRVILAEDPRLEAVPFEDAARELTDEQRSFREDWLRSRAR